MKNKLVLVPFPFDDLTGAKLRPALCLTDPIGTYQHVVVRFITSQIAKASEPFLLLTQRLNARDLRLILRFAFIG